jgi:tetratricopeptide (TPR) repeat protein
MRDYSVDEIRQCFSSSSDFNEIFDAFQAAITQKLKDVEPYRLLFWNHSLTADEVRLFGEKLANEFPDLAYDVFLWLASVFEVTYSSVDNFELALQYYQKAASVRPAEPDPYLDACDCYDPDLNIPPLTSLIEFVRTGIEPAHNPVSLYKRLAYLFELAGNLEQSELYRRKAEEHPGPPDEPADPVQPV